MQSIPSEKLALGVTRAHIGGVDLFTATPNLGAQPMTTEKKAKPEAAKSDYVPTPKERAIVEKLRSRDHAADLTPRLKFEGNALSFNHPEQGYGLLLLREALGSADADFVVGLLGQLASALPKHFGSVETQINFMLSVVKSIRPRDQVEAMLAAQMAIIHASIVTLGRRLMLADAIPQQDSAERALNKLARTFATQIEALERYRSTSEQRVALPAPSSSEAETPSAAARIPHDGPDQPAPGATGQVKQPSSSDQVPTHLSEIASAPETPAPVVPMKRTAGGR